MGALFGVVFGLVAAGGAILAARGRHERIAEAWARAASELGLSFFPASGMGHGEIRGDIRGVSVHVDVHMRKSGDSRAAYTRVRLMYPSSVRETFYLSKQQPFSIFARLFGQRDMIIGDPTFDSRVVIDAPDPIALDRFLTPARRMGILRMMESHQFVDVSARTLTAEAFRVEEDGRALAARIGHLVDIALVLSAPSDVDLALQQQRHGDLADSVQSLHTINDVQDMPPNSFTQFLEAEALVAMGDGEQASQILKDLPVFDAELGEWKTVAKNHPKPVELKPIAAANLKGPALEEGVSLDQQSVIDDLFDSERPGYEVEQRFFDVYESETVEWSGTVRRVREFRSDRDFPGAGVKATIVIGSRGDSKLVSNQVQAIVHLPEGTSVEPEQHVGFQGTFVRTDRYMRNLFVANAEIV